MSRYSNVNYYNSSIKKDDVLSPQNKVFFRKLYFFVILALNVNFDLFQVRELCVEKIALRKDVLSVFIKRICDVDSSVRLAVYQRLSKIPGFLKVK